MIKAVGKRVAAAPKRSPKFSSQVLRAGTGSATVLSGFNNLSVATRFPSLGDLNGTPHFRQGCEGRCEILPCLAETSDGPFQRLLRYFLVSISCVLLHHKLVCPRYV